VYAQSIVEERISIAERELGFRLQDHQPSDIDQFDKNLEAKYPDAYNQARSAAQGTEDPTKAFHVAILRALNNPEEPRLSPDEVRFMQNEHAMATCDAAYFLTRYYWIKPPQGIQRFTFLPGQLAYFNVISELEAKRAAIEMIVCKARQHGISTETEGLILQRASMYYGVNALCASADRGSTAKMAGMSFFGYDRLPWWLRPLSTKRVESDKGMLEFGGSLSAISFQHGNQQYGMARGDTVKVYHLSEVGSYANADYLIEASLFKCVHPHQDVFGALESTAEGDTGWWHDTYWGSKKNWRNGRSRLCPLFLPWWLGTDKYPTPTWIRTHPIPRNWKMEQETRRMISRAQLFVQVSPVLDKVVGMRWEKIPLPEHLTQWGRHSSGFPLAQAWYWECNFLEHRDKKKEKLWFQEMPTDDNEAFQGSYESVFGREVIAEVYSTRSTRYHVYGIVGQSIEDSFEPALDDVDTTEKVIPVSYTSRVSDEVYRWELWPLKWEEPFVELSDIRDDDSHMGKFFVWHPPEPGYDYSIGIDTSNGLQQDSTVIAVSRRGRSAQEKDEQAAEFRSNTVSHVDAYAFAMAVAAYYARYMEQTTPYREPYVSVEQILAVGDTCQLQMSKMGYARFHRMTRYDSDLKKIRRSKVAGKRGWFTGAWSRPILTDGFVVLVRNGWYVVNSAYTMREMTQWEVHKTSTGKKKYEHSSDGTDDGIFANAMAAFCPNDLNTMAERSKNQHNNIGQKKLPVLDISTSGGVRLNPDGYA
jgi:hypothetical protein